MWRLWTILALTLAIGAAAACNDDGSSSICPGACSSFQAKCGGAQDAYDGCLTGCTEGEAAGCPSTVLGQAVACVEAATSCAAAQACITTATAACQAAGSPG